ncbi:MAG: hypothetical protein PHX62_02210 [Bacilli bacterium]|nr:hypothetical protein [Bacilli bacterium]
MHKLRYLFFIISFIIATTLFVLIAFDYILFEVYFGIIIIVLILNFYFKRIETRKLFELTLIYINELEPLKYLEESTKYNKKRFLSKSAKRMDKITSALVLLDGAKIEEAHQVLLELVDIEEKMTPFIRFWYYKAWIHYYDEVDDILRMKFLADQNKTLITYIPQKFSAQILANYELLRARCFVKEGVFLDTAETYYTQVLSGRFPKLTVINCVYQLGLIAYKNNNFNLAKKRLQSVVTNGKNLNAALKARQLLDKIEKIENEAS